MSDITKEFLNRLKNKKLLWTVITMLATSIGIMGGFPKPPKVFINLVETYPILQWSLVFCLIFQGQGDEDIYWSLIGTGATYILYKVIQYFEEQKE